MQEKQQAQIEKEFQTFVSKHKNLTQEEAEQKMAEIKDSHSYFKPWFKVKVVDTLKTNKSAILTLFDIGLEGFESVEEGHRLRILNAIVAP